MAGQATPDDGRWAFSAYVVVLAVIVFSVFMGVIVIPIAQAPGAGIDAWTAICRAVGLQPGTPAQPQPPSSARAAPVSQVRWTPRTLAILASADPKPGAALAGQVCVNCHGEDGISANGDYPHLAGQSAAAIYKQLSDFRSGARANGQMTPVAVKLDDGQLAQLAVYYAEQGDTHALGRRYPLPDPAIIRLAHRGDPSRGIAPCESCHAPGVGGPPEAPTLTGQRAEYLYRQLVAYGSDQRRNDVYRRMRDIASKLTDDERRRLAAYYQGLL